MKKSTTKAQRLARSKALREQWRESKKMAENDLTAKALWRESGGGMSYYSFSFVLYQMKEHGFDGLPYLDMKTFNGWKQSGFQVRRGEKSVVSGIVWMAPVDKDGIEIEDAPLYPKTYHLFHNSQVAEVA